MTQHVPANAAGQAVEFWKAAKPAQAFVAAANPDESLSDGIGQSYAVIGYKGKIWSIRHRGETKMVLRPDDGTPMSYIDVVIIRSSPVKAKSYYVGGYDDAGSAGKRPDCASIDGIRPDPDVVSKQADVCGLC